jgi:hypothetical protein
VNGAERTAILGAAEEPCKSRTATRDASALRGRPLECVGVRGGEGRGGFWERGRWRGRDACALLRVADKRAWVAPLAAAATQME